MAALKICKEVSKIYESNGITLWVHDYIKLVLFQLKEIYNCCLRGLRTYSNQVSIISWDYCETIPYRKNDMGLGRWV